MKYASSTNVDDVDYRYFREFKGELESFATKDLSAMVRCGLYRNNIKDKYWIKC